MRSGPGSHATGAVAFATIAPRLRVDATAFFSLVRNVGQASASRGEASAIQSLVGLVTQQAAMIGYLDDFWLMAIVTVASAPLVRLLRKPKDAPAKVDLAHAAGE